MEFNIYYFNKKFFVLVNINFFMDKKGINEKSNIGKVKLNIRNIRK